MTNTSHLYFVKAETALGECVMGGHWLAESANHARNICLIAYLEGQITADKYGLPKAPPVHQVKFIAKRSKADAASMALNA